MDPISLPEFPKGHEFEEFISAFYQSGRFFIERNIIERDIEEVLELDIISTDYSQSPPLIRLIELKSGDWGFSDLFKLRGWIDYLNIQNAVFIVQRAKENYSFYESKAESMNIELITIPDISDTKNSLSSHISPEYDNQIETEVWRFSYWVERNLLRILKDKKKSCQDRECYRALDKYHHDISSGIFFPENFVERLTMLYDAFKNNPHISSKCAHELEGEVFHEEHTSVPENMFNLTYFDCKMTDIQISTFVEHKARLSILKNAVDYKIYQDIGEKDKTESFIEFLGHKFSKFTFLPVSFISGLDKISSDPYFHLYPIFWQNFLWLFGGFILNDYKEKEYEMLSKITGIPISEIPNAFNAYDALFPIPDGWFQELTPNSNIRVIKMFSIPFMGIGANLRLFKYTKNNKYDELSVSGKFTLRDLKKWNNLTYKILAKK